MEYTEYLRHFLGLVSVPLTAAVMFIYLKRPVMFVQWFMKFSILATGMKIKKVNVGGLTFAYGERGVKKIGQSSILLIHGFNAAKYMWFSIVWRLPRDSHVIALDLSGHGDSDIPPEDEDISVLAQVKQVKQIVDIIGLSSNPFHIIGASMGGTFAAVFSAEYPYVVDRLTLMCPAMRTPIETDLSKQLTETMLETADDDALRGCLVIPETPDELKKILSLIQLQPVFLPKQILLGVLDWRKPYINFNYRLLKAMMKCTELVEKVAHRITVPTQLVWGEDDQIIHVSGAEILKEKLPNLQQVDIISKCGHAFNVDGPGKATKSILAFRRKSVN